MNAQDILTRALSALGKRATDTANYFAPAIRSFVQTQQNAQKISPMAPISPSPIRAAMTDINPAIQKLSVPWMQGNPIKPEGWQVNPIDLITKAAGIGAYSPEEQGYFKNLTTGNMTTQQQEAGKSLGEQDALATGLSIASAMPKGGIKGLTAAESRLEALKPPASMENVQTIPMDEFNKLTDMGYTPEEIRSASKLTIGKPQPPASAPKDLPLKYTMDDIDKTSEVLNAKKEIPVTDIHGVKTTIPAGEAMTPFEMKDGKIVIQDGKTIVVNKNQYQNIKGQSLTGEVKPFAPELAQTTETVKSGRSSPAEGVTQFGGGPTKYSQYTLPGGENYREILIQAPTQVAKLDKLVAEGKITNAEYQKGIETMKPSSSFKSSHWDEPNVISHIRMNDRLTPDGKKVAFVEELQSDWAREARSKGIATEIKPEDIQVQFHKSTDIPEGADPANYPGYWEAHDKASGRFIGRYPGRSTEQEVMKQAIDEKSFAEKGAPNNPLLKNWQELAAKRALKDAVDNGADYFAWTNGDQQAARYNLSKQVDKIDWKPQGKLKIVNIYPNNGGNIELLTKDGKVMEVGGDARQLSQFSTWKGKDIAEIIGKGIGEKVNNGASGSLSGEGLNIGGEWAKRLYDEQFPNIIKDLTGQKPEVLDLGIGTGKDNNGWFVNDSSATRPPLKEKNLKIGQVINNGDDWIITAVDKDGKFKAIQDMVADNEEKIYTKILKKYMDKNGDTPSLIDIADKLTPEELKYLDKFSEQQSIDITKVGQQAIRITPELRAKILGKAPNLKQPSGKMPFNPIDAALKKLKP